MTLYQDLHDTLGTENITEVFCETIRETFRRTLDAIPASAKVAIRGGGEHTNVLLAAFPLEGKQIYGIFDRKKNAGTQFGYPCFPAEELPASGCDTVIVSSLFYRQEILEELRPLKLQIVDPYGELEKQGIKIMAAFDQYVPNRSFVLQYFYQKYMETETNSPEKAQSLHQALQAAVELKDFVMVRRICAENAGNPDPILLAVSEKTEALLKMIRHKISRRNQKDILIFWTDAVSYYLLPQMPLMRERSKRGCFFQRAYTHTPFTHQSLCAMFKKQLPIDDYEQAIMPVTKEDSPLIQYLEDKGYDVKFISHIKNSITEPYFLGMPAKASCNIKWWNSLEHLLNSERPCFCIVHILDESHEPNISPDLTEFTDTRIASPRQENQRNTALAYLDQCLALYNEVLGDTIQVYLSDHGQYILPKPNWSEERLHAYCFALGKGVPQRTVSDFFPYRNFEEFIKWLLEPERYPLEDACADEVVFQDTDFYNSDRINILVRHKVARDGLAVRGILNKQCRYAVNALGDEQFFRYGEDGTEKPATLEDEALRAELRRKCGTKFLDIYQIDQFQHTRKLYEYIQAERAGKP